MYKEIIHTCLRFRSIGDEERNVEKKNERMAHLRNHHHGIQCTFVVLYDCEP